VVPRLPRRRRCHQVVGGSGEAARFVTVTLSLIRYTVPASVLCTVTVWLLFSTPSTSRVSVTAGGVVSTTL
jgi:hypothetical protein